MHRRIKLIIGAAICLFLVDSTFAQGTAFTYQGRLMSGGNAVSGDYDFTFALYNNSAGNTGQTGNTLTNLGVAVTNGAFTVSLDFGSVFAGNATWLAVAVRSNGVGGFMALAPLQELTPTPYAIYTASAGSAATAASAATAGIASSVAAANITGTVALGQLPAALLTNNEAGVNLTNVTIGGALNLSSGNYNTSAGQSALPATASGGNNTAFGAYALYQNNTGNNNTAVGEAAMINNTIGLNNTAMGYAALANVNGTNNVALGYRAGVNFTSGESSNIDVGNSGFTGDYNSIRIGTAGVHSNTYIAGVINGNGAGLSNLTFNNGAFSAVFGGQNNYITSSTNSVIAGGTNNAVGGGSDSAVLGGWGNAMTNANQSTISGGQNNTMSANQSSIGGGGGNSIQTGAYYAFLGGGGGNVIQTNAYDSFLGSGYHNLIGANAIVAVLGGGQYNVVSNNAAFAVLGGGLENTNTGSYATIGGGANNTASASYATVPGGQSNVAGGHYSFAAGFGAQATNDGSFVWSDAEGMPFGSTTTNQFSVRANGGVSFTTGGVGVQVDGVSVLTAAPDSVQSYEINDGGNSAYQAFQQGIQALGGDTSVTFSNLFPVTATNGAPPAFSLTIGGSSFGSAIGFTGSEAFSQPSSYMVEVNDSSPVTNPQSEIGKTGVLTYTRNGLTTTFGGIVTVCALAAANSTNYVYTVQLSAPIAYLGFTTDYKIYQSKTAPAVATSVYQAASTVNNTISSSLTGSYQAHDSLTQFAETDLNFFDRILENEGVFYFFNQSASPPTLVMGDNTGAYLSAQNSPFAYYGNTSTNKTPGAEYIQTFQKTAFQVTKQAEVSASSFLDPSLNESDTVTGSGVGEYFEFGNELATLAYDSQLATNRLDIQTVAQSVIAGTASTPDLRTGYVFTLADQSGAGLSGSYVVTSVRHAGFIRVTNGVSTYFYGNQFQVIPSTITYCPPLKTPKPQALPCTATVTGETGQDFEVDEYGRVKVLFHWDRYDSANENSSAWVPVASPFAGANWGMIFLPRVGDDVLVSFIQGDPDQPIITGSLYNAQNTPPWSLPGNKTQSGITTYSSPANGGFNQLQFEDKAGSEQIYLHAQKDFDSVVLNNRTQTVDGNMTTTVQGNYTLTVENQLTLNSPVSVTGGLTLGGTLTGNGGGLTNLDASGLTGSLPAISGANLTSLNASQLTSGVVPNSVLPGFQSPNYNTLAGGTGNSVSGSEATVSGGNVNQATNTYATVGGGNANTAGGRGATVAGGVFSGATNSWATVGGGANNAAGGEYSTVPGGYLNIATGMYSLAAGLQAQAVNQGAFVWADSQNASFSSTANNQFLVRAAGGVGVNTASPQQSLSVVGGMNIDQSSQNVGNPSYALTFGSSSGEGIGSVRSSGYGDSYGLDFYTDFSKRMTILQNGNVGIGTTNANNLFCVGTNGAYCAGGNWVNGSDRNNKRDIRPIDPLAMLDKVASMPISQWQYNAENNGVEHVGPMAQDFHAAFGLNGSDDKHISTVDEGGVALAAIQGLNQKLKEKDAKIADLEKRLDQLQQMVETLAAKR